MKTLFWAALLLAVELAPHAALGQTPAPLQEWQYSSGIVLSKLFQPDVPEWQVATGFAAQERPLYEGARRYRVLLGPVIDVRYRDLAFASVGEGLGVNVLRGTNYRAGVAINYDLGRRADSDLAHLKGLGNISAAPLVKLFASYAVSKDFPLVVRVNVREFVGGANGAEGDLGMYMPLPGSSQKLVLFAGPSVTFANHSHMQTVYGINGNQALASGHPLYMAHGGLTAAGLGLSATSFVTDRVLINADFALERLFGSASQSPINQERVEKVFSLSTAYRW